MRLRKMTSDDWDFMLELKNYEETRKFSLSTPHEIKREDHIDWMEQNHQYFQVIVNGDMASDIKSLHDGTTEEEVRYGVLRVQDDEISIWVHREHRGKSYAVWAINQVKYFGMYAKIVCENIPSLRAFTRSGFIITEFKTDPKPHYILKYE